MAGIVAIMSWFSVALALYSWKRFSRWSLENDRVREGIDLSGHFLVAILITWQFSKLQQIRRAQLLLVNTDADYSGIAKAFHGWLVSVAFTSILLGGHSLVSSYETHVGFPRWAVASRVDTMKSSLRDPEVENFSLQVREGSYDPIEGWSQSTMTSNEPVTKTVYLAEKVLIDTKDILSVTRSWDEDGQTTLAFHLSAAAGAKLKVESEAMTGRSMAFILNGKVLILPKVNSPRAETSKSLASNRKRSTRSSTPLIGIRDRGNRTGFVVTPGC